MSDVSGFMHPFYTSMYVCSDAQVNLVGGRACDGSNGQTLGQWSSRQRLSTVLSGSGVRSIFCCLSEKRRGERAARGPANPSPQLSPLLPTRLAGQETISRFRKSARNASKS